MQVPMFGMTVLSWGRARIPIGSIGDLEQLAISRTNDTIDRCELLILYDPDDLDAELDRLHAEIAD